MIPIPVAWLEYLWSDHLWAKLINPIVNFVSYVCNTKSFFAKSRLPVQKWLILLYWWARQYPVSDAWQEAQVSERTAIQVYQWFRDVCSTKLLQMTIKLRGTGMVVQIDKSLYRHKLKARCLDTPILQKQSFHYFTHHTLHSAAVSPWKRSSKMRSGSGMVDTSQTPVLRNMEIVPDHRAATLLPIIQAHTLPGKIIHSDEWAARIVRSRQALARTPTMVWQFAWVRDSYTSHTP